MGNQQMLRTERKKRKRKKKNKKEKAHNLRSRSERNYSLFFPIRLGSFFNFIFKIYLLSAGKFSAKELEKKFWEQGI